MEEIQKESTESSSLQSEKQSRALFSHTPSLADQHHISCANDLTQDIECRRGVHSADGETIQPRCSPCAEQEKEHTNPLKNLDSVTSVRKSNKRNRENDKLYKCQYCTKEYSSKSSLNQHKRTKHNSSGLYSTHSSYSAVVDVAAIECLRVSGGVVESLRAIGQAIQSLPVELERINDQLIRDLIDHMNTYKSSPKEIGISKSDSNANTNPFNDTIKPDSNSSHKHYGWTQSNNEQLLNPNSMKLNHTSPVISQLSSTHASVIPAQTTLINRAKGQISNSTMLPTSNMTEIMPSGYSHVQTSGITAFGTSVQTAPPSDHFTLYAQVAPRHPLHPMIQNIHHSTIATPVQSTQQIEPMQYNPNGMSHNFLDQGQATLVSLPDQFTNSLQSHNAPQSSKLIVSPSHSSIHHTQSMPNVQTHFQIQVPHTPNSAPSPRYSALIHSPKISQEAQSMPQYPELSNDMVQKLITHYASSTVNSTSLPSMGEFRTTDQIALQDHSNPSNISIEQTTLPLATLAPTITELPSNPSHMIPSTITSLSPSVVQTEAICHSITQVSDQVSNIYPCSSSNLPVIEQKLTTMPQDIQSPQIQSHCSTSNARIILDGVDSVSVEVTRPISVDPQMNQFTSDMSISHVDVLDSHVYVNPSLATTSVLSESQGYNMHPLNNQNQTNLQAMPQSQLNNSFSKDMSLQESLLSNSTSPAEIFHYDGLDHGI